MTEREGHLPEHTLAGAWAACADTDTRWQVTREGRRSGSSFGKLAASAWRGGSKSSDDPKMAASHANVAAAHDSGSNNALADNGPGQRPRVFDWAPDLAHQIGSARWFRGFGTLIGLGAISLALWPDFAPLEAAPVIADASVSDEYRSQMILPLALGADSGRRMGSGNLVKPLARAPERPSLSVLATYGSGDTMTAMLDRVGLSSKDAALVSQMIGDALPNDSIAPGTQFDIVLGRRPAPGLDRPLESLDFRARFDLKLAVNRVDGRLALEREVIRIDDTPLRIRGMVGESLYRSARAAGAPAGAVSAYLKTLGQHLDVSRDIASTDEFDIVIAHRRAATGERQAGHLLYAGIDRAGGSQARLMRWGAKGEFFDAAGQGEEKGGFMQPVSGGMSSGFGMRRHPILGYKRMHSGLDFRGGYGTPIRAVTDGRVASAGRAGGCGNAVRLLHAGNIQTRYCHMSRMAVSGGQSVKRGQVIGYVGSTGLSTGPHLHYEMYRGGRAVDPRSVAFVTREQLSGAQLARFREMMGRLMTVEPGAALADLEVAPTEQPEPQREIEKLDQRKIVR